MNPTEDLTQALQGDAEAIRRVADRIYDRDVEAEVVQARALEAAQSQINAQRERADFLAAARAFEREFKDVLEDPAAYQEAKRLDAAVAAEHPELAPAQRLAAVGAHIRKAFRTEVDPDADARLAIREMQKSRGRVDLDDDGTIAVASQEDREEALAREEAFEQLKRSRMPHAIATLDDAA